MANVSVIKLKVRRGTDAQRQLITLDQGEIGYTTDSKRLFVGDGTTPGGVSAGVKFYTSNVGISAEGATSALATAVNGDIVLDTIKTTYYILTGGSFNSYGSYFPLTVNASTYNFSFASPYLTGGTLASILPYPAGGGTYTNNGRFSTIAGGNFNTILTNNSASFIGAGSANNICSTGSFTAIVAGFTNTISGGNANFIGAGCCNAIRTNSQNIIGAGFRNQILSGANNGIFTGCNNTINSCGIGYGLIAGGVSNRICEGHTFIGSGSANVISTGGIYSGIITGHNNTLNGARSIIAGGNNNTVSGGYSIIGGGSQHNVLGQYGFIGGGCFNNINTTASFASIAGGCLNTITTNPGSFIGGGRNNTISSGYDSIIVGGCTNQITNSNCSAILGGCRNLINGYTNSFILGSNITANASNFTYVNNISAQNLVYDGTGGNSSNWSKVFLVTAVSDETSNLVVGNNAVTFVAPAQFKLSKIKLSLNTATGVTNLIARLRNITTGYTATMTVLAGSTVGDTVISPITINENDRLTVDIIQVGSTNAGTGLKLYLIGNY